LRGKILVVRGGALGDFILTLPVLRVLRKKFPQDQIDIIGHFPYLFLAKDYLNNLYSLDNPQWSYLYSADCSLNFLSKLLGQPDIIVSYLADISHQFNLNLKKISQKKFLHVPPLPSNLTRHISEHLSTSLRALGLKEKVKPRVVLPAEDMLYGENFWQEAKLENKTVVAIHPGSGSKKKRWPLKKFIQLASKLQEGENIVVLFILGEAEEDLGNRLETLADRFKIISGLDIIKVASLLSKCSLYIGNDSGVTHLAAALDIPTLALFGPTDPKIWEPLGKKVSIMYHKLACSPCLQEERNKCSSQKCLETIGVEEVLAATRKLSNILLLL